MSDQSTFTYETSSDEKGKVTVNVKVPKSEYTKTQEAVIEEYKPHVELRGFRKGKVPANIIMQRHAKEIKADCETRLSESAWDKYATDKDVKVFTTPQVVEVKNDDDTTIKYSYYPMKDVEIPELSEISVEKEIFEVNDESVKIGLRLFYVSVEDKEIDGPIEPEDRIVCDVTYEDDKYKDFNRTNYTLLANDSDEALHFSKNTIGMKKDEEKTIETNVAGESVKVKIKVTSIHRLVDKEAPTTEEEIKQLEDMKKNVKTQLEMLSKGKEMEETNRKTVEAILEKQDEIDVPEGYIEESVDTQLARYKDSISHEGWKYEEYLAAANKNEDEVRLDIRKNVLKSIRIEALYSIVLDQNKDTLKVDENRVNMRVQQMYNQQMQEGLKSLPKDEQRKFVMNMYNIANNEESRALVLKHLNDNIKISDGAKVPFKPTQQDLRQLGMQ